MKKSIKKLLGVAAAVLLFAAVIGGIKMLFSAQYNPKGISHFLVITIDENQPRSLIGELEGHRVYMERLDPENTCFRNIHAQNVSVKEALDNGLVSIKDWRRHAFIILKDGDAEVLRFENYEIAIAYDDCVIRPLSR